MPLRMHGNLRAADPSQLAPQSSRASTSACSSTFEPEVEGLEASPAGMTVAAEGRAVAITAGGSQSLTFAKEYHDELLSPCRCRGMRRNRFGRV